MVYCDCSRWIYPEEQEVKKCPTCLSLEHHKGIYGGLSSEEAMKLYKKRTAEAFGVKNEM